MIKKSRKFRAIQNNLMAAGGLMFLAATNAVAQDAVNASGANPPGVEATTSRVIVTGSYIPTAESESALPVTVYTAEVLQKQGANTPVEGLRQLPSFVGAATTENDSNGGTGQAGINLRGIGQQNVLVLVNGRRAFLGQGLNLSADINAIPISGLSRTEVLKDGASAVYGSDAVAGVVNFLMLDGPGEAPYVGAEINVLYGNTTDHDAHVRQAYVRGGVTGLDGKVSIAASAEYYSRANLFSRDRAIATTGDTSNSTGDPFYPNSAGLGWGGLNNNSASFAGRVSVTDNGQGGPTGQLVLTNPQISQVTPASYRTFDAGADPAAFNFQAFTPAIPAVEKVLYFVTGRYKIFGDGLQLYGDLMYAKTKQDNGLAAAPFILDGTEASASIFNPFGTNLSSIRYRLVQESGLRREFFDHDYWRYVIGLNGNFTFKDNGFISRLGYDTGFVYERFDELRIDSGDATHTAIVNQIEANLFNPFIGQSAPIIGNAPTYTIDPVTGAGVPTGATAPYNNLLGFQNSSYLGHSYFYERDFLYDIKLNAHLFPNLWNGGIDVAAGYEHRNIAEHSVPDPVQAAGDQLGFDQSPNTKTLQEVDSFFTEVNLPIVTSTMNVPFIRSLEISFAYRYEKFKEKDQYTKNTASFDNSNPDENFGGSPRVSLRYQPIPDLTLRANWNQSFRGPTPTQLFNPVIQDFPVLFDPVQRITLQPPQGVWRGGNSALKPETTDAYSVGMVYTPKFLPGFTMTADYYQLFTTNLILSGNNFAQVLLSQGVVDPDGFGNGSGAVGATGGTGLGVTRDPADNSLLAVDSTVGNAGKRLVTGMDITAVYQLPTANWGQFTFSAGYNHFFSWKAEPGAGLGTHNFLGDFNATIPLTPGGIPFNKAFLRAEWEWRGLDFNATGNYIGDMEDDPNFIAGNDFVAANPGTLQEPNYILHRRITSYITLDMQLSYEFKKPETQAAATTYSKDAKSTPVTGADVASFCQRLLWGTKVTIGVNNAFDRQPPSVLGAFNDNYDTSNYSIRNRYWYVSLSKKF
ncbi:MAG: iron complex outerrane recepter protein [Verrucomicrobiota bacterium]